MLAGDGLQARGFGLLAAGGGARGARLRGARGCRRAAGGYGGQQSDLEAEEQPVTAAMVRAYSPGRDRATAGGGPGWWCGTGWGPPAPLRDRSRAGLSLGLAFQGADDVLDVTGTAAGLAQDSRQGCRRPGRRRGCGSKAWTQPAGERSEAGGVGEGLARMRRRCRPGRRATACWPWRLHVAARPLKRTAPGGGFSWATGRSGTGLRLRTDGASGEVRALFARGAPCGPGHLSRLRGPEPACRGPGLLSREWSCSAAGARARRRWRSSWRWWPCTIPSSCAWRPTRQREIVHAIVTTSPEAGPLLRQVAGYLDPLTHHPAHVAAGVLYGVLFAVAAAPVPR